MGQVKDVVVNGSIESDFSKEMKGIKQKYLSQMEAEENRHKEAILKIQSNFYNEMIKEISSSSDLKKIIDNEEVTTNKLSEFWKWLFK